MIEARGLSKRYGDKVAVDDLTFTVRPGRVTGFLGPNGAGKTTTMRMILGLDRPTAGSVTVNGKPFAAVYSAMREVGALLDAKAVHGGRSADHDREQLGTKCCPKLFTIMKKARSGVIPWFLASHAGVRPRSPRCAGSTLIRLFAAITR
jgi:energy-coupling factor transporter ATP-binding protein EcfA2